MAVKTLSKIDPLNSYDLIIATYSGGKDSTASYLDILDQGADPSKVQLWHNCIDGKGSPPFMDWPSTPGYVRAFAAHEGVALRESWKDGGFEREMNRENQRTAGVWYEPTAGGEAVYLPPSTRGKESTRRQYPQVSADLSVRWCSAYLKIDVAGRAINNDPDLKDAKILYLSGERRQESSARAKYATFEHHRCSGKRRVVHQYRNVIEWSEKQVWDRIERAGIVPHPAYYLGWGRLSCMTCIFGNEPQWASVLHIARERFDRIAHYEAEYGKTIHRKLNVIERAGRSNAFDAVLQAPQALIDLALAEEYPQDRIHTDSWKLPAGAFSHSAGPS